MFDKIKSILLRLLGIGRENTVDYIGTGEALPAPLEPDAEKEAIERLMNKDEDARQQLIEHNLRLVVYIAKKFENSGVDIEDLISIGTIGLIKAVGSFDGTKQIKLATYASRCIENEILMYLRKVVKTKSEMSLDEPLNVDFEGNVLLLSDVLGTDSDVTYRDIEKDEDKKILLQSLDSLNKRELDIVKMRFGVLGTEKKTQKEIADILGISQSYISRLEKKVMQKLRKEIIKLQV